MSSPIKLKSGRTVTRYWKGKGFFYPPPEDRDADAIAALAELAQHGFHDWERSTSSAQPPPNARWASPICGTCEHPDPHWIAAGQDICTAAEPCNCENYVPKFKP
jgi:hypothetical protein